MANIKACVQKGRRRGRKSYEMKSLIFHVFYFNEEGQLNREFSCHTIKIDQKNFPFWFQTFFLLCSVFFCCSAIVIILTHVVTHKTFETFFYYQTMMVKDKQPWMKAQKKSSNFLS